MLKAALALDICLLTIVLSHSLIRINEILSLSLMVSQSRANLVGFCHMTNDVCRLLEECSRIIYFFIVECPFSISVNHELLVLLLSHLL